MKKILVLMALLLMPLASANVIITEVMFDPTQTSSQTDSEWIEIYNNGEEAVDLSLWKIDESNFDDIVLQPGKHLVIARELLDTTDEDNESFESYWGNNNGIWDENFLAVDGSFSLTGDDMINLSNGVESEVLYYDSTISLGNGKSIFRLNYSLPNTLDNWAEGELDGTPGKGEYEMWDGEVMIEAVVVNVEPEILNALILTDDSTQIGIQIMPNINENKMVNFYLEVKDNNGLDDVVQAGVRINGREYAFTSLNGIFNESFEMLPSDTAMVYNLEFFVKDNSSETVESVEFEYLGFISSVLETSKVTFDYLVPGTLSSEETVSIRNSGNVVFDVEVEGYDVGTIGRNNLEVFYEIWQALNVNRVLDANVMPNEIKDFKLRLNVPENVKADTYEGKVKFVAVSS
jgi:hypothetical protein